MRTPPTPEVRRRMRSQLRRDTEPELRLRRALFAAGLRYRCAFPVLGRPRRTIDIAFTKQRLAVFVDGCFWHGCPDHFVPPKRNADWWGAKIAANRARDAETDQLLISGEWRVLRIWEHTSTECGLELVMDALIAD